MIRDPHFKWDKGAFPYDILAAGNFTPLSGMEDLNAVFTAIKQAGGNLREAHQARSKLQSTQERLLYDFFFYQGDYGDE